MNNENKLWLSEAMYEFNKELKKGEVNLINAPAGSGKSFFVFKDLLNETYKYYKASKKGYEFNKRLNKVLYVCDTSMLKDAMLSENREITQALKKDGLIEAKNASMLKNLLKKDFGTIKVITYSQLGVLLKNEACKYIIMNNFDCIIMDELQNLFKYCSKYNVDKKLKKFTDGSYVEVIENLGEISEKVLTIGLSATPSFINQFQELNGYFANIRGVFSSSELKKIRSYNFDPIYTNCIMNFIKTFNYEKIKELVYKIYINTPTITQAEKYKEWFTHIGLKAEWLCSTNNKEEIVNINENGEKIIKEVSRINGYKKLIRDRLLKGTDENGKENEEDIGTLPNDLDVLIVNSGYETGWNLIDKRIQIALIDNTDESYQVQARNRIRHNILNLVCLWTKYDESSGEILEKGQYGELVPKEIRVSTIKFITPHISIPKMKEIDEKYIGVKMNKNLEDEMIYRYGIKGLDRRLNFKSLKRDLIELGYVVKISNNGTYIFRENEEFKKDSKKELKKMTEENELLDWLLSEWDKKQLTCKDVIDYLEIPRRSWDRIKDNNEFINKLKENDIKIGLVKGGGRTKYFIKD